MKATGQQHTLWKILTHIAKQSTLSTATAMPRTSRLLSERHSITTEILLTSLHILGQTLQKTTMLLLLRAEQKAYFSESLDTARLLTRSSICRQVLSTSTLCRQALITLKHLWISSSPQTATPTLSLQ